MISKNIYCYRKYLNPKVNYYVEVINECPDYINMILEYTINGKRVLKPSPTFGPGKIGRITFPGNAINIDLKMFDSSFNPPAIICTRFVSAYTISRYKVIGPAYGDFQCITIE